MPKIPSSRTGAVREPVQVYLAPEDNELLNRLSNDSGLSKAEILRRGVRMYAREQQAGESPMLRFLAESSAVAWPENVAANHDAVLTDAYRAPKKKRR